MTLFWKGVLHDGSVASYSGTNLERNASIVCLLATSSLFPPLVTHTGSVKEKLGKITKHLLLRLLNRLNLSVIPMKKR